MYVKGKKKTMRQPIHIKITIKANIPLATPTVQIEQTIANRNKTIAVARDCFL